MFYPILNVGEKWKNNTGSWGTNQTAVAASYPCTWLVKVKVWTR